MKQILSAAFILAVVFSFGCERKETPAGNSNASANSSAVNTQNNSAEMPKTEKSDKDFVESESGIEKSKPEAGKANVQGKVFYNEKPAEGIEVKICEKFSRFIGGCDGETFKTKTDANGEYLFANVTPGTYEGLLVKVFDSKSYVFATKGIGISSAKYKFDADKTFFAPDTNLFKDDLKIQSPKANSAVKGENLEIKWDAYPDAAYYELSVSPENFDTDSSISNEKVEGTSYKVAKNLKSGKYSLGLTAYNANKKKLAEMAENVEFTVAADAQAGSAGSDSK